MFVHKVDRELSLKLAGPEDADALFQLTEGSREYLREWLPWLDFTKTVEDTKSFIESGRRGFSENKSMTTMESIMVTLLVRQGSMKSTTPIKS
ncbi:hypothetical protein [Halobacillus trueperi]|uniref:hypothetical protein n=1 Tax=Halobacillus trueperi TaxID=156205 RepID=UPI002699D4F6|nr:hypothetical protein [Halobacillus trueperi]